MSSALSSGPIIIGVDGSHCSKHAFDWALANLYKADDELVIVYAFEPPSEAASEIMLATDFEFAAVGSYIPDEQADAMNKKARDDAHRLVSKYAKICDDRNVNYRTIILEGDARDLICHEAENMRAKALVVGSRGRGALKRWLMGSTSSYLVHNCHRPVIVVRDEPDE
eukprot:Clim_evm14s246 gene=Clim_evmTU14s246